MDPCPTNSSPPRKRLGVWGSVSTGCTSGLPSRIGGDFSFGVPQSRWSTFRAGPRDRGRFESRSGRSSGYSTGCESNRRPSAIAEIRQSGRPCNTSRPNRAVPMNDRGSLSQSPLAARTRVGSPWTPCRGGNAGENEPISGRASRRVRASAPVLACDPRNVTSHHITRHSLTRSCPGRPTAG